MEHLLKSPALSEKYYRVLNTVFSSDSLTLRSWLVSSSTKPLQKREHLLVGLTSFHTCSSASATVLLDLGKGRGEEMHLLEGKEKTRRATRAQRPTKASPCPDGSGASCRPPLPVLSAVRSRLPVEEPKCPVSMGGWARCSRSALRDSPGGTAISISHNRH